MQPPLHRTVGGLGLATIVAYGGWFYGFGVLVQPISDDTGWSVGTLGASYAVAQLLTGGAAAFGGRLLDEHGGAQTFALGGLLGGGLLALAAAAPTAPLFAVAFALGGAVVGATAFYHVTMAAARRLRPDAPARAIGPLTIWGAFASPIFLPITAWLVEANGWRPTLGVLAATTAGGLLVAAAIAPGGRAAAPADTDTDDVPLRVAVAEAWQDPAARRLLVFLAGNGLGTGILLTYQVPIMVAFGLPLATAATVAGARGFLQLTGRLGLSWIVERFGSSGPLAVAMLLAVVACFLLVGSGALPIAIAFAVVAGASMGATSPLSGIHASAILPERHLGALLGAVQVVFGVATATGPLLGGVARDLSGSYGPALGLAVAGFSMAGLAMARARTRDRVSGESVTAV